jgi:hypothetical protein
MCPIYSNFTCYVHESTSLHEMARYLRPLIRHYLNLRPLSDHISIGTVKSA